MIYKSNLSTVMNKLTIKLKGIANIDPLLQEIAVSLASSNTNRIHNQSKDVKETEISYKIGRKTSTTGAYSSAYAKKRSKKGRQISRVDFSFSGKLSKEFQAAPTSTGWVIGWTTIDATNKGENLEKGFGQVWGVTRSDEQAINKLVTKTINKRLK